MRMRVRTVTKMRMRKWSENSVKGGSYFARSSSKYYLIDNRLGSLRAIRHLLISFGLRLSHSRYKLEAIPVNPPLAIHVRCLFFVLETFSIMPCEDTG